MEYELALERFRALDGDLLSALGRHASWTSSATHAVLPLLATDAGVRAQVQTGVDSHRARFGEEWQGGFWLPECAHAPHLEPLLQEAGVRATCVEMTNRYGLGAREHLRPLVGEAGVVLVPIDRTTIARVWSDDGYPADACYRDYHRHTTNHHKPWANDGSDYDHERALARAREHAREFVEATRARLRAAREGESAARAGESGPTGSGAGAVAGAALLRSGGTLPGGGLVVCALDTELLGHWWYEGVTWLREVVRECERQDVELVRLDDAVALADPAPVDEGGPDGRWPASTWGRGGDLSTWSGPAVAQIAFETRGAELRTIAAGRKAGPAAVRELLALQSSDWAFMVSHDLAVPYARERFERHRERLARALARGIEAPVRELRNLAPGADPRVLLAP